MGVYEDLMAKLDEHIAALNANTQARLAEQGGGNGAAAADAPKRGRPPKAKDEPVAPKVTEDQLVAKFDELKSVDTDKRMPQLKKVIADLGFSSLKDLRGDPSKFDAAMDALVALEATFEAPADDDDL